MFKIIFVFLIILLNFHAKSQNSPEQLKVLFHIDSVRTTGPYQVLEKITDTFSISYCEKNIYFTITIMNISDKRLQLVKNSGLLDIKYQLFDYEIDRFDSLLRKYVPIQGDLVQPLVDGQNRNLFINPQSKLVFNDSYKYSTRLGEINRCRVVLRLPKSEFTGSEIFSEWKTIIWNGIQGPSRFSNNTQ